MAHTRLLPLVRNSLRSLSFLAIGSLVLSMSTLAAEESTSSHLEDWKRIDADFVAPPNGFRVIQYSGHEGVPLPVEKMREAGIGGVNLFMQKTGYLRSEEAWANVLENIKAAKAAGLQLWMADDNGYPSGMAGGRVVEADPSFEVRCLTPVVKQGNGPGKIQLTLPERAEKFVSGMIYPLKNGNPVLDRGQEVAVSPAEIEANGLAGPWVIYGFAQQINDEGTQAMQTASGFDTTGHYANLLNTAAMEKFVDMTHAEYARRLGPLQGQIDAFYSNEPNLMSLWFEFAAGSARPEGAAFVPWDSELPLRFKEQHGYDLPPLLPALFTGESEEAKLTRRHFYQTVGSIMARNFSGRIAKWAEENGTRSAGHPLLEESMLQHVIGYGDFFQFLSEMQIPACDIGMPGRDEPWNFWMPKFLSSVAQIHRQETVCALLDPLINQRSPNMQPLPEDMRRIVNMAFLCGINQITTYIAWDKYDPAVYRQFSEYVGRLSVVLRGARNAATVGVFYPIETFQANFIPSASTWDGNLWPPAWRHLGGLMAVQDGIVSSLITSGIDFNWLDGGTICKAKVEKGRLTIGINEYSTIVMPQIELLPLEVAHKLEQFEKSGGTILWVNSRPTLGDGPSEHKAIRQLFRPAEVIAPGEVAPLLANATPKGFDLSVEGAGKDFFIARFIRDGRRINYVVNNRAEPVSPDFMLRGEKSGTVTLYNPMNGSITKHELANAIVINPVSSLFLIENPE